MHAAVVNVTWMRSSRHDEPRCVFLALVLFVSAVTLL